MQKLLFIDSSVPEPALFDRYKRDDVILVSQDSIDLTLETVTELGFMWKNHYRGQSDQDVCTFPSFPFPTTDGGESGPDPMPPMTSIPDIVAHFPNLHAVNLITCNLREDGPWQVAFDELKSALALNATTGPIIKIRYSTNRTGEATEQDDWIFESDPVEAASFLDLYLQNTADFHYPYHLSYLELQDLPTEDWYEIVNNEDGTKTLNLLADKQFPASNWKTLDLEKEKITKVDGNGRTLTLDADDVTNGVTLHSVFYFGTHDTQCEINDLTFKIVDTNKNTDFSGLVYSAENAAIRNMIVRQCSVHVNEIDTDRGGMFGQYAGKTGSVVVIDSYVRVGGISGWGAGGIFGRYAGSTNGSADVINSYVHIGPVGIKFYEAGGVFGRNAGSAGSANVIDSYVHFESGITGNRVGGVFGSNAGDNGGSANAIASYVHIDYIRGSSAGGMFGAYAGSDGGSANAIASYVHIEAGSITGIHAAGMFATYAAYRTGSANAIASYVHIKGGGVYGNDARGMFGYNAGGKGGSAIATLSYHYDNNNGASYYDNNGSSTDDFETFKTLLDYNDVFYTTGTTTTTTPRLKHFLAYPWNPYSENRDLPRFLDWGKSIAYPAFFENWHTKKAFYLDIVSAIDAYVHPKDLLKPIVTNMRSDQLDAPASIDGLDQLSHNTDPATNYVIADTIDLMRKFFPGGVGGITYVHFSEGQHRVALDLLTRGIKHIRLMHPSNDNNINTKDNWQKYYRTCRSLAGYIEYPTTEEVLTIRGAEPPVGDDRPAVANGAYMAVDGQVAIRIAYSRYNDVTSITRETFILDTKLEPNESYEVQSRFTTNPGSQPTTGDNIANNASISYVDYDGSNAIVGNITGKEVQYTVAADAILPNGALIQTESNWDTIYVFGVTSESKYHLITKVDDIESLPEYTVSSPTPRLLNFTHGGSAYSSYIIWLTMTDTTVSDAKVKFTFPPPVVDTQLTSTMTLGGTAVPRANTDATTKPTVVDEMESLIGGGGSYVHSRQCWHVGNTTQKCRPVPINQDIYDSNAYRPCTGLGRVLAACRHYSTGWVRAVELSQ